jgi:hypothetical protein
MPLTEAYDGKSIFGMVATGIVIIGQSFLVIVTVYPES